MNGTPNPPLYRIECRSRWHGAPWSESCWVGMLPVPWAQAVEAFQLAGWDNVLLYRVVQA